MVSLCPYVVDSFKVLPIYLPLLRKFLILKYSTIWSVTDINLKVVKNCDVPQYLFLVFFTLTYPPLTLIPPDSTSTPPYSLFTLSHIGSLHPPL